VLAVVCRYAATSRHTRTDKLGQEHRSNRMTLSYGYMVWAVDVDGDMDVDVDVDIW